MSGRYYNHANYGNMVIIEADNGNSYVSLSAHLLGLAEGIVRGARVTDETIIGYAGDTGNPTTIPVGPPHLNQTFYRKPKYSWVNNAPIGPTIRRRGAACDLSPLRRRRKGLRPWGLRV